MQLMPNDRTSRLMRLRFVANQSWLYLLELSALTDPVVRGPTTPLMYMYEQSVNKEHVCTDVFTYVPSDVIMTLFLDDQIHRHKENAPV